MSNRKNQANQKAASDFTATHLITDKKSGREFVLVLTEHGQVAVPVAHFEDGQQQLSRQLTGLNKAVQTKVQQTKAQPAGRMTKARKAAIRSAAATKAWITRRAAGVQVAMAALAQPVAMKKLVPGAAQTPAVARAAMLRKRALKAWRTRRRNAE